MGRGYTTPQRHFLPFSVTNKFFPSFFSSSPINQASSEAPSNLHFLSRSPSTPLSLLIFLWASHHHHRTSSSSCCARCLSFMTSGSGNGGFLSSAILPLSSSSSVAASGGPSLLLSAPSFLFPALGRLVQLYQRSRGAAVACES